MTDIFEASPYTLLGVVDDVHICDCCGKKNLNRTVALEKDGATLYFGTTCAARALTGRRSRKTGEIIYGRALMVQKCRDALGRVLAAIAAGECPNKAAGHNFDVSHGHYSDTGNKKPLKIYWGGWCIPGVELPPSAY